LIVENFSQKVVNSNITNTYVATAFFATLIFFVLNANSYTPIEMIVTTILITIGFKGVSNMMLSLIILLFNLEKKDNEVDFEKTSATINSLLNELSLQKAKIKTNQLSKD
jgi:hypothetical protein